MHSILRLAVIFYLCWIAVSVATAQHHCHGDECGLPDFYATWLIPDSGRPRVSSCCNEQDCYSTPIQFRNGRYYARRREDQKWIPIPRGVLEQEQGDPRESPDGASHVCMQPPGLNDRVYCAVLGSAI